MSEVTTMLPGPSVPCTTRRSEPHAKARRRCRGAGRAAGSGQAARVDEITERDGEIVRSQWSSVHPREDRARFPPGVAQPLPLGLLVTTQQADGFRVQGDDPPAGGAFRRAGDQPGVGVYQLPADGQFSPVQVQVDPAEPVASPRHSPRLAVSGAPSGEGSEHAADVPGGQLGQLDPSQVRDQVQAYMIGVAFAGAGCSPCCICNQQRSHRATVYPVPGPLS